MENPPPSASCPSLPNQSRLDVPAAAGAGLSRRHPPEPAAWRAEEAWLAGCACAHLGSGSQGFLKLSALLLLAQASLVTIIGHVAQYHGLLGDGQDATLHR